MGATDAVAYCQSVVDEIFGKQIDSRELLAWLDDLLGYAKTQDDLLGNLKRVLAACKQYGMKLHAGKCTFFTEIAKWVGKVISTEGVSHNPERVSGLVQMRSPKNAGELQQFLCAVNWMRMNIPEFSKITAKLYEVLERAASVVNSRKKNKLLKVQLSDVGWDGSHEEELQKIKQVLLKMVPLSHALPENDVCLFTDASLDHWGAIVTQVPPADSHKQIGDQKHQPLAFLSGKFTGAAARWPIIEKEAFAIVESCKRLEYLLLRPRGFKLYTDHRNLVYIFDPLGFDGGMARYQADKLQRWAMTLTMFRYEIEHVSGEDNVWGDLLSRWGAQQDPPVARMAQLAVVQKVSPLQDKAFDWPTQGELVEVQLADIASRDEDSTMPECSYDSTDGLYKTDKDQIWIPDQAAELQQRLLVVAHAGASGHFGEQATLSNLQRIFYWSSMESDVKVFMRACLHCIVAGPKKVLRPYGPALHATKPNELLHWDFLTLPQSETGAKNVLVLRDDMSGFVEFIEC
jgi:hypothetical protein